MQMKMLDISKFCRLCTQAQASSIKQHRPHPLHVDVFELLSPGVPVIDSIQEQKLTLQLLIKLMNRQTSNPSQEWKSSVNSTLNRLNNQYLTLLRTASSAVHLDDLQVDPRSGGGTMRSTNAVAGGGGGGGINNAANEPPPPLASSTTLSTLTTAVATQNMNASVNDLLDLMRVLRLSILIMGKEREDEENVECWEDGIVMDEVCRETRRMEEELLALRRGGLD